jgi:hypothetical protein
MNPAYISALSALAGSAIGALASFATTWLTQSYQNRSQRAAQETARRERIFGEFIDQTSKLYVDALTSSLENPTKLVAIYAVMGKLRLFALSETITKAEEVLDRIVQTYYLPPIDLHQHLPEDRNYDVLRDFTEACRVELRSDAG